MERTWTTISESVIGGRLEGGARLTRKRIEAAIDDLDWQPAPQAGEEIKLPAMPGMAIQNAIQQLRIPKVSLFAYRTKTFDEDEGVVVHSLAPFGFYGIEGHYRNGRARIYLLDGGDSSTPVCSDLWPSQ